MLKMPTTVGILALISMIAAIYEVRKATQTFIFQQIGLMSS